MTSFKNEYYLSRLNELKAIKEDSINDTHVVVLGAGLAGLSCAYELQRLGVDVTVLESSNNHIGGRARTYYDTDGLYCEFGAMRIPEYHGLTRHYADELGLTLRKFVQNSKDTFALIRDKKVKRTDKGYEDLKTQFNLTPSENKMTADEMWEKAVITILDGLSDTETKDLYAVSPKESRILELDKLSLLEALKQSGLSDEAIEYQTQVYGLETYLQTSLLEHLREELESTWTKGMDEIVGGTDKLASKLAASLRAPVMQGARVTKCTRDSSGYVVHFTKAGNTETLKADWVVCTIPLGSLVDVDLQGCISHAQRKAIRRTNYDSSIKVLVKCKTRFWETQDGIFGGGTVLEGSLGHIWYPSDNAESKDKEVSNKASYLLAAYTWGQHSRQLDSLTTSQLHGFVQHQLKKVHPRMPNDVIEKIVKWSWNTYSGSAGAFAFFNPREYSELYKELKRTDTRFLFAGEHASLTHSWMQGAFESAIDACHTISKANST